MPAFRSILVPIDGSSYSMQALPLAEAFAKMSDAIVHVVMVHQPGPMWFNAPEFPVDMGALDAAAWNRETACLEGDAQRFAASSGLRVRHGLLEGDVHSAIEAFVKAQSVDLVVMTSHGRSGLTRLWLGRTADKLVRHLPVPVLVVRPVPDRAIVAPRLRRILVPLDGSSLSAAILGHAKAVARTHGAELVLATIVQPIPVLVPPVPYPLGVPPLADEVRMLEDQRYLEAVRNRLRVEGLRVESRVLKSPKVGRGIVELGTKEECDLIMMATHGAGGLDRLLLGSVTDQVIRRSSIPVLVLRPTQVAPRVTRREADAELVAAAASCTIG